MAISDLELREGVLRFDLVADAARRHSKGCFNCRKTLMSSLNQLFGDYERKVSEEVSKGIGPSQFRMDDDVCIQDSRTQRPPCVVIKLTPS